MIKFIACDLDDSLLDRSGKISPENKAAIKLVREKGIGLTIATGRMFQSAAAFARELGLDEEQPLICYNGALVQRLSGETLYHEPLPTAVACKLAEHARANDWVINAYLNDELYVQRWDEHAARYATTASVDVKVVPNLAEFMRKGEMEPAKLLVTTPPEEVSERIVQIRTLAGDFVQIAQSWEDMIEITRSGVHKGKALLRLVESMGLDMSEVMAIGDSSNDLTMLEMAGLGIAMGNAGPEIKNAADYVTLSNGDHGVAYALNKYVLGKS